MKYRALVICPPNLENDVFPPEVLKEIHHAVDSPWLIMDPEKWRSHSSILSETDFIIGTWGMPKLDEDFLSCAPKLRAIFYAAGSVKGFVTEAVWNREIVISSAWMANGIPVAEYALGVILLSLKRFWHLSRRMREESCDRGNFLIPGAYHSRVGLVSMGAVGRATARLLRNFELDLLAFDPHLPQEQARELGVSLVSLEDLFQKSDVVSIHAPWIPETERMIGQKLISSMKEGATLINTSRGAVIAEEEMCEVLLERKDLSAVLDVSCQEPIALDSPLRILPNVVLTPHIGGSLQSECARMGSWMAAELRRFATGEPLHFEITRKMMERMA